MDWKYDNLLEADEWFPCNWVYSDQENSQEENQLASCGEIRNVWKCWDWLQQYQNDGLDNFGWTIMLD